MPGVARRASASRGSRRLRRRSARARPAGSPRPAHGCVSGPARASPSGPSPVVVATGVPAVVATGVPVASALALAACRVIPAGAVTTRARRSVEHRLRARHGGDRLVRWQQLGMVQRARRRSRAPRRARRRPSRAARARRRRRSRPSRTSATRAADGEPGAGQQRPRPRDDRGVVRAAAARPAVSAHLAAAAVGGGDAGDDLAGERAQRLAVLARGAPAAPRERAPAPGSRSRRCPPPARRS